MKKIPLYLLALAKMLEAKNSICGGITMGADYDCDNPLTPGVNQRLILIDRDNIEDVTYDITTTTLITDLVLKTGSQGYSFQGIRQALNPQYQFVPQTVSVGYDHQVDFLVFDISQEQKDNLEIMGLGNLVAIVENKNTIGNDNSVFEVYGLKVGLELQTNVRIPADTETGGAFSLSLMTSPNEGKEPKMPQSWWVTDYATTKVLVDATLSPAP